MLLLRLLLLLKLVAARIGRSDVRVAKDRTHVSIVVGVVGDRR